MSNDIETKPFELFTYLWDVATREVVNVEHRLTALEILATFYAGRRMIGTNDDSTKHIRRIAGIATETASRDSLPEDVRLRAAALALKY